MAELSNEKKRVIAEGYYINNGMKPAEISGRLDVSVQTVYNWIRGRKGELDWDARKTNLNAAPHRIREIIMQQMELVASGEEATVKADSLLKLSKVFDSLSDKTNTQTVISVFMEFDNWMAEQNPQIAADMTEWHKHFIFYKASLE